MQLHKVAAACALTVGVGMLIAAVPASAAVTHVYTASYAAATSTPANPYPVSGPTEVAVDQASHDLYVTDPGNHRVEKFDSAGNFILMFGKGVDQTKGGDVCTAASGDTCQAGTSSSAPGGFQTPTYLAVDNSNGDIYVADTAASLVSKFDSTGHIVSGWGKAGQKDGSDTELTSFLAAGGITSLAVGGPNGDLYVGSPHYYEGIMQNVFRYTPDGAYESPAEGVCGYPLLKVNPAGDFFSPSASNLCSTQGTIMEETPGGRAIYSMTSDYPTKGFAFDPSSEELYQAVGTQETYYTGEVIHGPRVDHYGPECNPPVAICEPTDVFGEAQLASAGPMGVAVDGTSHAVYVADSTGNDVAVFGDARPIVAVGSPNPTETSVTLNAHIDPAGRGAITACHVEYGFDKSYGATVPCAPDPASSPPGSNFSAPTDVTATIGGLSPGTHDHYRFVVSNSADATTYTPDQVFITTQAPAIDGLASANLTATTADLNAQLNPNGLNTTYRFEYGPTTAYGQSAPVPDGSLSASNKDQAIGVHLANLTPHVVYHYTLIAINADGTTTAPDHTFNFYPPSCPNENVRQQTQANYLPDCRAYELVSPGDANGTQLYPGGPNTGYATSPSRFSFTGIFGTIPGTGGDPINGAGDLYVATRTDAGWVTRYVGLPANQAAVSAGPPMGLPGQEGLESGHTGLTKKQDSVLTNPDMSTFLVWNDGGVGNHGGSTGPYVYGAGGSLLDRWPTNLATVPSGVYPPSAGKENAQGELLTAAPGGLDALDCLPLNACPGDVTASSDLSHFVFASEWNVFASEGQLTPPGSVYDNDTGAGTVEVASRLDSGAPIPAEPTDQAEDPLRIPAVSGDGSHILIAAGGIGPCGQATCPPPAGACGGGGGDYYVCPLVPSHLYLRVDGAVTYDVSQGHDVKYVGITADGSKVFFTSKEQLTGEDHDASVDLYVWELATDEITLISKGNNPGAAGEPGQSDACSAGFTTGCGALTYSVQPYCVVPGARGGNCLSDSSIASRSGEIYFFSPEQLDGSRGISNKENLYLYRNGKVQYVTTFTTGPFCEGENFQKICANTPIARMQVTPDGSHMAFLTAGPVTQYDNAGHLEMYLYDPATRTIVCASCIPSGASPTSNVGASQDGLFIANDGRVSFSTSDPLVLGDTNEALDVYEYVNGSPQLITPGTGATQEPPGSPLAGTNSPGLIGVSATGADVYFSTYDTLVPADHNGLFLKFYDARAAGGFSSPAPPPPCDAADECHGVGNSPPGTISNGTGVALGAGGNAAVGPGRKKPRHPKKKHHARRRAHHRKGGSR
jgi:DNA-binding beta-propeller fold protein YncE